MKREPQIVHQGIKWLAEYLLKDLNYTKLGEPYFVWDSLFSTHVKINGKEYLAKTEETLTQLQKDVESIFKTLPKSHYPSAIKHKVYFSKTDYVTVHIWYTEEV